MERALTFGSVAEDYERYRPGYPTGLVALLTAPAHGQVTRAIEIGAGTGKATRVLAAAGIAVSAVEPDPRMLAVLARTCEGLPVEPIPGAFEQVDPAAYGVFDLLYAAAAWHWTDPVGRWDRTAALVRPGGAVGFVGGPIVLADGALERRETELISALLPDGVHPAAPNFGGLDWPGDELLADDRFDEVTQDVVRRRSELTREQYLRHLSTVSAYQLLSDADRTATLSELGAALPDRVMINADLVVHRARRI
ncbi:MAG: class I SAM-dependent methyltransferase [Nocardioides sp.]|uniref:class I SAM-dependent methyltransferase n=1 Tax=Nocardioides sp. TaxID=35761 RepID=UPI0039E50754